MLAMRIIVCVIICLSVIFSGKNADCINICNLTIMTLHMRVRWQDVVIDITHHSRADEYYLHGVGTDEHADDDNDDETI